MSEPLIGISTDFASKEPGRDARFFLKESYVRYFREGGARVVLLPFAPSFHAEDWSFLDGIVLSGSGPDIPPRFYGESQKFFPGTWMAEDRVTFEFGLLEQSEKTGTPAFGICGGFQTMNVYRGGTLIQDLLTLSDSRIPHHESDHSILMTGPWSPRGGGDEGMAVVNSFHHQGVERAGANLEVLAISPEDRLIEAFRDPVHPFFLGVQWHPERRPADDPVSLFLRDAFLDACRRFRSSRHQA